MTQHILRQTIIPICYGTNDNWHDATAVARETGAVVETHATLSIVDGKHIRTVLAFYPTNSTILEPTK